MKLYVQGGVRRSEGEFAVDYEYNLPSDIIDIQTPQLYQAEHGNHIYWFGYEFNPEASSKDRSEFIAYLKGLTEPAISEPELIKFLERPLKYLNQVVNLYSIDCLVYPLSGRSELVRKLISTINSRTSHEMNRVSFELVKSAPQDIEFDYESFDAEFAGDENTYKQIRDYIDNTLIPNIHTLDYFSLAHSVKPKYRKYIKNYLTLSESATRKLNKLQGSNILVVDDINTSGATLDEILRILGSVNPSCNIYIYTLIGRP